MNWKMWLRTMAERIGDFFFVRRADEKLGDTVELDLNEIERELHTNGIA